MTLSLTHSLTESLRTFNFDIQRDTLETCDLWHLIRVMRRQVLIIFDNFDIYGQIWQFLKLVDHFFTFWQCSHLRTILKIFGQFDNFAFFWQFGQFLQFGIILTMIILETCCLWDIDYNSDNWEPKFVTLFMTWQFRVTLDRICNSCDVSFHWMKNVLAL